jgi:hypothetical protein
MAHNSRITNPPALPANPPQLTAEDERTLSKAIARIERKSMAGDADEDLVQYLLRVKAALAALPSGTSGEAKKMLIVAGLSARYTSLVAERCASSTWQETLNLLEEFVTASREQAEHEFRGLKQGARSISEWRLTVELVGARAKRNNSDIVQCFIEGLTDVALRAELTRANNIGKFDTLNQLMPVVLKTANSLTGARKKDTATVATLDDEHAFAFSPPGARQAYAPSSQGAGAPDNRTCFKCKRQGHLARACPNTDGAGGGNDGRSGNSQLRCQLCDATGHEAGSCSALRPPIRCQWCKRNGHGAKECRARLAGKGVNALEDSDGPLNEDRDQ